MVPLNRDPYQPTASDMLSSTTPLDPQLLDMSPFAAAVSNLESIPEQGSSKLNTNENTSRDDTPVTERSNLRMFPPPIFSRQGIPQFYK